MAFESLRDWLNQVDQAGELKRRSQPVATDLEITELADREVKKLGGGKALPIEKPTINGQLSPFPVAIDTLGSHRRMARMAMSLGAKSVEGVAAELGSLIKAKSGAGFCEAAPPLRRMPLLPGLPGTPDVRFHHNEPTQHCPRCRRART